MKITCPKCDSTYRVDLPDPGEAGIDVQCGKCFHIFLFSTDIEKPGSMKKSQGTSVETQDSGLPEDSSSEIILPPQKDEDQEVSGSKEQPSQPQKPDPQLVEMGQETLEELELEPITDDPEPIEIVVEDEIPEESLEEGALEDIWDQAVQEGARTVAKSKEKSSIPPPQTPAPESIDEETIKETPSTPDKGSKRLLSLEDRQREIDQMIADHQIQQKESGEKASTDKPETPTPGESPPQDKTQEEIDLEEQVVIDEGETLPNWEEAFVHQSKVEEGWKKAQEQDRILEEQQLADALGKKTLPDKPIAEEIDATVSQGNQQDLVDEIFIEAKAQKEIEPEEQVVVNEGEVMPSWEEAFADQSEVESRWGKSQEEDRIHEEQQLADALGEEYVPPESSTEESVPPATQENKKVLVDQLFEEVPSQQESDQPPETKSQDDFPEIPSEKDSSPEIQETHVGEHTIPGEIDLMTDLDDLDMKQLVTQAFKEESESQEKAKLLTPETTASDDEGFEEPELTMESMAETLQDPEPASSDPVSELEMESISDLTLESAEEELEPAEATDQKEEPEMESISDLTLESAEEELEPVEAIDQEEPELESISDLTLESAEEELEPVEATDQKEEPEMESISDLTLESAEEEPEPVEAITQGEDETMHELESLLEAAETPEEVEALIAEIPLEMESESEPTVELHDETETSAEQTAKSQEPSLEDGDELMWGDLLAEHEEPELETISDLTLESEEEEPEPVEALAQEEEKFVEAEIPVTPAATSEEENDDPFEENDFWDQVLEKDPQESETVDTEAGQEAVSSAPAVPDTAERETLTDEELWKQAFPGDEELEAASSQSSSDDELDSQSEPAPLVIAATVPQEEDLEDSLKYDEAAYADYDDEDDDEFEFQRRKRKLGPFRYSARTARRHGYRRVMVVFLLIAGSVYFTLQTFSPGELTDIQTAKTEVPEGLTPREVPLEELAEDLISSKPEKTPPLDTPGDKGKAILSDPAEILKEAPEEKGILKDLAESQILKDTGKSQTAKIDQSALEAFTGHSVTMSTIMPVAYNPTDIRVLSFSVEIQLSDARSAKRVRESMPVYEEIMNQTVESFLRRKFYNDILYVKEKLQKRLQTAMNQSLKNGRVKKAKFTDFAIQ